MTRDDDIATLFARFDEAQDALGNDDLRTAQQRYREVRTILDRLGRGPVESDDDELTWRLVLEALATIAQHLEDWPAMREASTQYVADVPDSVAAWTLHAIALKHTGDAPAAQAAVLRAIELDPDDPAPRHEHACQLAVAGKIDAALDRIAEALDRGAERASVLDDDELAALRDQPRFQELVSDAKRIDVLVGRLRRYDAQLADHEFDDEAVELYEATLPIVREVLELAGIAELPRHEDGYVRADDATDAQRAVLEAVVACAALWKAIPFLNVMGEFGLPSLMPSDTRVRVGLFDDPDPWVNMVRRLASHGVDAGPKIIEIADRLAARHPPHAEMLMMKALALMWLDEAERAMPIIDAAIALDPAFAHAHLNRGYIATAANRFDDAIASLRVGIELMPEAVERLSDADFDPLRDRAEFRALAEIAAS